MQQIKALVSLGTVDDDLIPDQGKLRWRVLADCLQRNLCAIDLERQHRRDPLDPLQQASGKCCKQKFHRVHRIAPPRKIGVERDFGLFRHGEAAMLIDAAGVDAVFHQMSRPISSAVSTLPVETTFSSTTSPGVDITP